jgi:hypothetical protein
MSQSPNEADDIQRKMREVRAELRDDVQDLMVSAHQLADWTLYVKAYPWLCVGAALAAGFLIVPGRSVIMKPDAEGLIELAKKHKLVVKMDESTPQKKKSGSMFASLLGLAASTVLQTGLKVATQQLSQAMQPTTPPARSNGRPGGVASHD